VVRNVAKRMRDAARLEGGAKGAQFGAARATEPRHSRGANKLHDVADSGKRVLKKGEIEEGKLLRRDKPWLYTLDKEKLALHELKKELQGNVELITEQVFQGTNETSEVRRKRRK